MEGWPRDFGPFRVYIATRSELSKLNPRWRYGEHYPVISDGRGGEIYCGGSAGARELAKDLLDAADAYDTLVAEMGWHECD